MRNLRKEYDPPLSIEKWGWKYHHLGIPTQNKFPDEQYLSEYKFFISGFSTSPFGIEWMRFEADSPINELVQKVPHIAFEVINIDYELENRNFKVIVGMQTPAKGIRVAMIEHNGAPIELIEFDKNNLLDVI